MQLRIMSSNIWGNCPREIIAAERPQNLSVVYHRYTPDLLGFQEFSPVYRGADPYIGDLINDVYAEVPVVATNSRNNNFTPAFYKKERFSLLDYGYRIFMGPNDIESKSVTYAVLEEKTSKKRLVFINAHYFWEDNEKGRVARISNSKEMISLIDEINGENGYPLFLTGDLNCTSSEPPIEMLREAGLKEARYSVNDRKKLKSFHPYPPFIIDAEVPHFGVAVMPSENEDESIDHILFKDALARKFVTVTDTEALSASDHCPIFCDFEI